LTLARAHAARADYAKSVAVLQELIQNVEPGEREALQRDLDEYKSKLK
jgi:hypothetical protein